MQFRGFKLLFDDSVHEFYAEGEFTLEGQPNNIVAIMKLDNLDIAIRPIIDEGFTLEIDSLLFKCSNLSMEPQQRSIILTVNRTTSAA